MYRLVSFLGTVFVVYFHDEFEMLCVRKERVFFLKYFETFKKCNRVVLLSKEEEEEVRVNLCIQGGKKRKDYSSMNLNGFSRVDVEKFNPGSHWLPNSALFLGEPRVILEDSVPFLFRRGR